MSDAVRPTFSRGWYGYTDDEIDVAMDAILRPESVPQESHIQMEPERKASPIIDKTLLLGVCIDLIADQRTRLTRLEAQVEVLRLRLAGLEDGHGLDGGSPTDLDRAESAGGAL